MKSALLGFVSVICAALAVLPMLVETGQPSAHAELAPQPPLQPVAIAAAR